MKAFEEKFKKLGIASVAELSLITPHHCEDHRLHNTLRPKEAMLLDATVISIRRTPASLQLRLYAHNLAHEIDAVIFKPKPYMLHQFQAGIREYLYGNIQCSGGKCSLIMPKKVSSTNIGTILPIYKTALRSDVMRKLTKELLTLQNLLREGIPHSIAEALLEIHFPTHPDCTPTKKQLHALKFTELFVYMKALRKKKRSHEALSVHAASIEEWMHSLPFELTPEQKEAIEEIRKDFLSSKAAKRMIVGDVGSGKTMIILAAALMNHPNRSVLMAPTTVLANQLYKEAKRFLPALRIALVTNKSKIEDLETYDFIIGTHALLYSKLPPATLVMVDEQHRFGTKQRHALQKLLSAGTKRAHYLQFSATPIPRTQAMIESQQIDVTLVTSTPYKKDISSSVIHKEDFGMLIEHIRSEISHDRQILIIYPLVESSQNISYQSIDQARSYWERNFTGVYVTHGKDKDKEAVLEEFREKGNILIATTVVEVGISLPRLSTIVIVGAERLGLATLHQLRGRVSRTGLKGYCFLYTNQSSSKRLEEFCKTTSGFDIARLDLKYRSSGDILHGQSQSGREFKWFDMGEDANIVTEVVQALES